MPISFEIRESKLIQGVKIIKPSVSSDLRGNIWTSFLAGEPQNLLPSGLTFKHDKFSLSKLNDFILFNLRIFDPSLRIS